MFWEEGKGIAAVEDREYSEIPSLGKEHPDLKKNINKIKGASQSFHSTETAKEINLLSQTLRAFNVAVLSYRALRMTKFR
ncbi:hypothetical protein RRG08_061755 [Elysia crispata]|uniref:Uncharacterized protein n=1 Tax=Elysia crispata TaxID=231223 RepID=A0AAE1A770_9GAST|nr:hypothetical protein RRG08_061755 [Elysia crispata]